MTDKISEMILSTVVPNKPLTDKRSYRVLTLTNGLMITLISDPTTDKSAAAVDVNIGSLADPWEAQGLAHFCEHMVFMGSDKYPEENYFTKYLSANNGQTNAFTSAEHTNFYFDIVPDKLKEAVDIFGQFFICPLFTASATDRELQAVNSEHEKNLCIDFRRSMQLDRHLSAVDHDYHKFSTGNLMTLKERPASVGYDVRKALLSFHKQHYSANIMSVCLIGKELLDELEQMAVGLFGAVNNFGTVTPHWDKFPWRQEHLGRRVYVVPVRDIYEMWLMWPMADYRQYYHGNPDGYVSHLIGHEARGSILAALKSRGWANKLSSGCTNLGKGFAAHIMTMELFETGLDHVDEIIGIVYQYINKVLRQTKPQRWVFDEERQLREMCFRYRENRDLQEYVSQVARDMRLYDPIDVIEGPFVMTEFRPDLIEEVVKQLVPSKMNVYLFAKKFEDRCTEQEPWYGTKYSVEPISIELLQLWLSGEDIVDDLHLPEPNIYIPTDFSLKSNNDGDDSMGYPELLIDSPLFRLWFCKDNLYLLPKGFVFISFSNLLAKTDPVYCLMNYMIVDLFSEAVNEDIYDAMLANLDFKILLDNNGIRLRFSGFNEKIPLFVRDIVRKLVEFSPTHSKFELLKEIRYRQIRNFRMERPLYQADRLLSCVMSEVMWTQDDLLGTINDVTYNNFNAYFKDFFSQFFCEVLVYGNFQSHEAVTIVKELESVILSRFSTRPLSDSQVIQLREVLLPENSNYTFHYVNEHQPTSAIISYLQGLAQNTRNNVLTNLCDLIMNEPIFNKLRTEEQLGYIVGCNLRISNSMQGHRIYLQSMKRPDELDLRVSNFLINFYTELKEMSSEEFKNYKSSLKAKILERPKDMMKQFNKFWIEVFSGHYKFNRDIEEVDELSSIEKIDLLNYYEKIVHPHSPYLKKFSVYIVSKVTFGDVDLDEVKVNEATNVHDFVDFKTYLPLSHLIKPTIHKVKVLPTPKL